MKTCIDQENTEMMGVENRDIYIYDTLTDFKLTYYMEIMQIILKDKYETLEEYYRNETDELDNDLVDFAMQIPNKLKVSQSSEIIDENDLSSKNKNFSNGKVVLRKAIAKYLDDKVSKARKQGFSSPDASWFRGESIDFVKTKLLSKSSLFDFETVKKILQEHNSGEKNNRLLIWSLLYINQFNDQVRFINP